MSIFKTPFSSTVSSESSLSVDDWGLSPAINDAILSLVERRLVYSVSILANSAFLTYRLNELIETSNRPLLGLHFNLTEGHACANAPSNLTDKSGKFLGLSNLLRIVLAQTLKPRSSSTYWACEAQAQMDQIQRYKIPLDFLDGHHHVHLLPSILDALLPFIFRNNLRLRIVSDPSHIGSYLLAKYFSLRTCWNIELSQLKMRVFKISYLTPRRGLSAKTTAEKIGRRKSPVLVHVEMPSLKSENDFWSRARLGQFVSLSNIETELLP